MQSMKLTLGAVAYDAKVVNIWEGFKVWFAEFGFDFDYILYSNYERQVQGHFAGEFDIAWNSPLAWLETEAIANNIGRKATAFAMRDTDQNLTSLIISNRYSNLEDLRGKTIGVGAADSPQATWIPLEALKQKGLVAGKDFEVQIFDRLFGKHGDHIGGERLAAEAMLRGEVDACCLIDANFPVFKTEGILSEKTQILLQTETYDHCVFTSLEDTAEVTLKKFANLLFSQSYDDPKVRHLLDMEGLKLWKTGRVTGFNLLSSALRNLEFSGAVQVRNFIEKTSELYQ